MTHYPPPSPYQPPAGYYGYAPPPDLAAPGRKAGMLMIIMGICILLLGTCLFGIGRLLPKSQLPPEMMEQIDHIEAELHVSWQTFMTIGACFVAAPGILLIILGPFVRRGGMLAAVLGVVVSLGIVLYLAANILQGMFAASQGSGGVIPTIIFSAAAIGLFGLQIFWLAKAVINAGPLKVFNQQQQAYQWQMQQQMYAQQQMQYPMPPPPPPPPQS